ncbi:hypothetical protein BROUX41_001082 [Berkeleyomyces rouxiae]|uniref:uncharacterized protein n=1 Tax=Berkeleyomyces rouxiae TaxID=2035830 RepID=UPI003B7EF9AE
MPGSPPRRTKGKQMPRSSRASPQSSLRPPPQLSTSDVYELPSLHSSQSTLALNDYRREERAIRLALIFTTGEFAAAFGGLTSATITGITQNYHLSGWRWLLRMEGVLSMISAIVIKIVLPDYPEKNNFLDPAERELAVHRLFPFRSHRSSENFAWKDVRCVLNDWRLYIHYLLYFLKTIPLSGLFVAGPLLMHSMGYTSYHAQLMIIPPYVTALVVTVITAILCDRRECRGAVSGYLMIVGAVGFLFLGSLPVKNIAGRYIALMLAATGSFATFPILLAWLSMNMPSTPTLGFALGLNVAIGAPAQLLGAHIYSTSNFVSQQIWGHGINSLCLSVAAVLSVWLSWIYARRNRPTTLNPGLTNVWAC